MNFITKDNCKDIKPWDCAPIEFKPLWCGKGCGGKKFEIMWEDSKVILKCIKCGKFHINRFNSPAIG